MTYLRKDELVLKVPQTREEIAAELWAYVQTLRGPGHVATYIETVQLFCEIKGFLPQSEPIGVSIRRARLMKGNKKRRN